MTVWLVVYAPGYEASSTLGVFATMELAEAAKAESGLPKVDIEISKWDVEDGSE